MTIQRPSQHLSQPSTQPSPFRVVPPTAPAAQSPAPPAAPKVPAAVAQPSWKRRVMVWGAIALGFGGISMIPLDYQVGGDVELSWRETARQSVHAPMPAMVERVLVQTGDRVQPGQPILQLVSRDLEREIADVQEKLAQAYRSLEQAEQEHTRSQAALLQAIAQEQATRDRASRVLSRVSQLEQGVLLPEMQILQVEQQRLEERLLEASDKISRYEELLADGAIASQRVNDERSIYLDIERDLAANVERMRMVQRQLQDEAIGESGNVAYQEASVLASQLIVEGSQQISAQQNIILTLEQRLQHLQQERSQLMLTATTEGTVITSDLDLLVGKEVRSEGALIEIAELSQLVANVEIKEEDLEYVQIGKDVSFRPRQSKLESYGGKVDDILNNVEVDATQQQRVAMVRVVIDNPEERLRLGATGYAKIYSERIFLYERLGRELLRLIPERFL
ncbi:efflux RND transporter periplasmic adaptor subunit [Leptolyngbya sp. CCY15150]|uniref:HlyD family secretion protein n=1 Tax=Leptolyngbya sp. CCY15150 TaxID=2767772 RepID=UPI00194F9201|nr:efflux RND transporter periplasmic adaptor subunit [Leptolyngbya sp. CCY15150]